MVTINSVFIVTGTVFDVSLWLDTLYSFIFLLARSRCNHNRFSALLEPTTMCGVRSIVAIAARWVYSVNNKVSLNWSIYAITFSKVHGLFLN